MRPSALAIHWEELRDRYLRALLKGDRRAALSVLVDDGLGSGADVSELQLRVVQEAQREIGRLWEQNIVSIAQEHMATAISKMVLAQLFERAPQAAPNGRKILVACVEGELHDFPARLVADALDLAGFDVRYLGANVPTESLAAMVLAEQPDLVALSATMAFNVPSLRRAVALIRREAGVQIPIAIGGSACEWVSTAANEVKADLTARDAQELVEGASRLLGVGR